MISKFVAVAKAGTVRPTPIINAPFRINSAVTRDLSALATKLSPRGARRDASSLPSDCRHRVASASPLFGGRRSRDEAHDSLGCRLFRHRGPGLRSTPQNGDPV